MNFRPYIVGVALLAAACVERVPLPSVKSPQLPQAEQLGPLNLSLPPLPKRFEYDRNLTAEFKRLASGFGNEPFGTRYWTLTREAPESDQKYLLRLTKKEGPTPVFHSVPVVFEASEMNGGYGSVVISKIRYHKTEEEKKRNWSDGSFTSSWDYGNGVQCISRGELRRPLVDQEGRKIFPIDSSYVRNNGSDCNREMTRSIRTFITALKEYANTPSAQRSR